MKTRVALLALMTFVTACGDDDAGGDASPTTTTQGSATTAAPGSVTTAPAASGDRGSLTMGDETIEFTSTRCFLEEQESAGGGGSILATAQGFGTNAAGVEVAVDFARYSEDSDFAGDDLKVTVGDPFSAGVEILQGTLAIGSVSIVGDQLSGTGFTLTSLTGGTTEVTASFELTC